jgi:hypothetical protein
MEKLKQIGTTPAAGGNGYVISRNLNPRLVSIADLKSLGRGTRKHPPEQVRKLVKSLKDFGFVLPILIAPDGHVVAGWGLVLAARQLGLAAVPAVKLEDLSEADLRLLRLALNRLTEDSSWDLAELHLEFSEIRVLDPHIELKTSGFELGEINGILQTVGSEQEDELHSTDTASAPVTRLGDLWLLGDHRLLCGDPSSAESYNRLLSREKATMVFGDASHRLAIGTGVPGSGAIEPADYAQASEMSSGEGLAFLKTVFGHAAHCSIDDAIHFVCTPWQHMKEAIIAGEEIYGSLGDVSIWIPQASNARKGFLHSPEFKLVLVFQVGKLRPTIKMARGRDRQHRMNVWHGASQSALYETARTKSYRRAPGPSVSIIEAAIRDCSKEGDVILDPFGHVGTTLIAAERTRRRGRAVECDLIFADRCIERWQRLTGGIARHADTGHPFAHSEKTEGGATAG